MPRGNTKNLKKGNPGNKGVTRQERKDHEEVRKISRKLILNPTYQKTLQEQLEEGRAHPSVQSMLWAYAYGKPADIIEEKKVVPVSIEMVLDPSVTRPDGEK